MKKLTLFLWLSVGIICLGMFPNIGVASSTFFITSSAFYAVEVFFYLLPVFLIYTGMLSWMLQKPLPGIGFVKTIGTVSLGVLGGMLASWVIFLLIGLGFVLIGVSYIAWIGASFWDSIKELLEILSEMMQHSKILLYFIIISVILFFTYIKYVIYYKIQALIINRMLHSYTLTLSEPAKKERGIFLTVRKANRIIYGVLLTITLLLVSIMYLVSVVLPIHHKDHSQINLPMNEMYSVRYNKNI